MTTVLKLEELAQIILGFYICTLLQFDWWWFFVWFLAPDIGMIGYVLGAKVGALTYNLFHHKGIAIAVYLLGTYLGNEYLQFAGIILFAHAAFDRFLGYGLKYEKGFKYTHLGDL